MSAAEGRIELDWSVEKPEDGETRLSVTWREIGGPRVSSPDTNGFGRAIFERQLPAEIGADASIRFPETGVEARIAMPMSDGSVLISDEASRSA